MDQLSPAERAEVETHLTTFPELRIDLREIEAALEFFAKATSLSAPAGLKTKIMDALRDEFIPDTKSGNGGIWRLFALLFGLGVIILGFLFFQRNNDLQRAEDQLAITIDTCNQAQQRLNSRLQILQQLTAPQNQIIPFTPTTTYPTTDLYLHHNTGTGRNFIQVRNLPAITANESYELWSIKPDTAPAPLDVFETVPDNLIEVQFVEGTAVYAITIEQRGGAQSPDLTKLIGTATIPAAPPGGN